MLDPASQLDTCHQACAVSTFSAGGSVLFAPQGCGILASDRGLCRNRLPFNPYMQSGEGPLLSSTQATGLRKLGGSELVLQAAALNWRRADSYAFPNGIAPTPYGSADASATYEREVRKPGDI